MTEQLKNGSKSTTLHAQTELTTPEGTARAARTAYPDGNTLMKVRDAPGTMFQDQTFASLLPHNEIDPLAWLSHTSRAKLYYTEISLLCVCNGSGLSTKA